ncbi:MAG: glycosyltransferase [Acidimicrobiales bacterium]|nr:glycosyltransferase [Acidimicrobiales bacterium]
MKVLQFSTWNTACGIADYTACLRAELLDCGGDIDVDVWPVDRIANNYRSHAEIAASLEQFVEAAVGYDAVHIQHEFSFFSGSYGVKTSIDHFVATLRRLRKGGTRVVTTFHTHPRAIEPATRRRGNLATSLYFRGRVGPAFSPRTGAVAVVHNRLTRRALIDAGVSPAQIRVIPIGMPAVAPITEARRADAKRALGLPPLSTVLGMFGFVTETKGHLTALEAMRALPDEYYLLIVGGPHPHAPHNPLDDILRWLHDNPAVASRVVLTGYVDAEKLADLLASVDVNIAPYDETPVLSSSAAITRAMASGRPVVASRIPAFLEINEVAAECLALCSPGSPFELAHQIEEVVGKPDFAKQLALNCESYASANSWTTAAGKHAEMYRSLTR